MDDCFGGTPDLANNRIPEARLQLFTAGGSSGDLKIDGLSASVAEQLRIFILAKVGTSIEHDE